ncbi:hypothetical protein RFI_09032 [Reticulomyxa filosa]|uniref:EF-hand domain-containing protein n=1 Tax=Reticulomyxa filosa TaxID=46433 RepID=X6NQV8_RETFI|nr:hypothetical protein RFI_09032 [Reticulomyxa filosa]|eukprot:ETO28099.1 hypothetical protein RFI_09032 [Reticulomyxa filosa]
MGGVIMFAGSRVIVEMTVIPSSIYYHFYNQYTMDFFLNKIVNYHTEDDCYGCAANCEQSYEYFERISNPWYSPNETDIYALEVITEDELCYYWDDFVSSSLLISHNSNISCSDMFIQLDTNDNQVIGFHEFLYSIGIRFGLYNSSKGEQLDCSMCMQHPDAYNW